MTCSRCGNYFTPQYRTVNGKQYPQAWCPSCRKERSSRAAVKRAYLFHFPNDTTKTRSFNFMKAKLLKKGVSCGA